MQYDRLALRILKLRIDILHKRISRWPPGTPGGKGGQFAPGNQAGGGDGAAVPARPDTGRFSQGHASVKRINRRLDTLHALARAGDVETIRSLSTSRGNSYERVLDDYRQSLLAHFEARSRPQALRTVEGV